MVDFALGLNFVPFIGDFKKRCLVMIQILILAKFDFVDLGLFSSQLFGRILDQFESNFRLIPDIKMK